MRLFSLHIYRGNERMGIRKEGKGALKTKGMGGMGTHLAYA
jgi:hypothetical protein